MFTGIIEGTGIIESVEISGSNKTLWVKSDISYELKPDQSISHDGVCLTVEEITNGKHKVTAIVETLIKSTLKNWKAGYKINLERCMQMNGRLDGHIVQGHVDTTAICIEKEELTGSWKYSFMIDDTFSHLVIEKGSVCVNGISLTCFSVHKNTFSVAIIPYTYNCTNIKNITVESLVNIEFDIIGKYLARFKEVLE